MNTTRFGISLSALMLAASFADAQPPAPAPPPDYNAYYQIGPDSLAHDGVPRGEMRGPFVLPSQAYPGTQHTYWVYVPARHDPAGPRLMIFQDGQAFKDGRRGARAERPR
jgi:enterochelin esterase family protein